MRGKERRSGVDGSKVNRSKVGLAIVPAFISLVLLLGGCGAPARSSRTAAASAHAQTTSYRVVDATGSFWEFWKNHGHSDLAVQVAHFKEVVVAAHPELFARNVIGVDPTKKESDLDERLEPFLRDLPTRIGAMRKISRQVATDLSLYDKQFRAAFPDMKWSGTIYFTISVDAFNGALRNVDGKMSLLFGIDKIAKLSGENGDVGPLFHHELFHLHHNTANPLPDPVETEPQGLLDSIWREGLATYISGVFHPDAPLSELLFSEELALEGPKRLPQLARELRALLDSATEAQYRDYFLGRGVRTDLPKRSGYFVGYLVAKQLAKRYSLKELVHLGGAQLRSEVDQVLEEFSGR